MQHYWSLEDISLADAWLTIGSFDGVHLGHQAILRELIAGAQREGVPAVVLTFFPHPVIVLRGPRGPYYLTSPEERAGMLGELGVDVVNHNWRGIMAPKGTPRPIVEKLALAFKKMTEDKSVIDTIKEQLGDEMHYKSPEEFAKYADRISGFQREAKLLASLN